MVWLRLKGEQLSGSAYYFNGCKALMFSSVVRFNQATLQLRTWVKASASSVGDRADRGEARPVAAWKAPQPQTLMPPVGDEQGSYKIINKLISAGVRESQT